MNKQQALNILTLLHDDIDGLANGREYGADSHIASLENVVRLQEFVKSLPDNFLTQNYKVSEHFMPAFINGDRTGLSDDDEAALDAFIADNINVGGCEYKFMGYDYDHEPPVFTTCDITGLCSNCVTLKLVFKKI